MPPPSAGGVIGRRTIKQAEAYSRAAERGHLTGEAMHLLGTNRVQNVSHLERADTAKKVSQINNQFSEWCPGEDSNLHACYSAST